MEQIWVVSKLGVKPWGLDPSETHVSMVALVFDWSCLVEQGDWCGKSNWGFTLGPGCWSWVESKQPGFSIDLASKLRGIKGDRAGVLQAWSFLCWSCGLDGVDCMQVWVYSFSALTTHLSLRWTAKSFSRHSLASLTTIVFLCFDGKV